MTPVQRSIFFSAVERYASLALFFAATAVLSRLLTPAEFGIYAVVNALTAVIMATFQEFGGGNYLIQKHGLSRDSVRTAFTVTFAISALVGVVLFALSGPLSRLFSQDGLRAGIAISSLNFLIAPFSGTLSALYRRKLEFGTLAICNFASIAASSAVAIALALLHFSYLAPIWGNVAGSVVLAGMLLLFCRDIALFRPSLAEYRDVIGFGLYSSGVGLINVFYNRSPQLFMARILDFAAVGLYSRAVALTQVFDKMVVQVLNPVIMPAIVARRTAGDELRSVYLQSLQFLAAVQWPALIFVALMAQPIILIWLGHNWLEIVPLVRLLCVANMALFAACLSYPVLVAVGNVRDALISSLISLPPSLLLILGASFLSVDAVAASALLTLPFQAAVAFHFIGRRLQVSFADVARALVKSAVATAVTAAGVAASAALVEVGVIGPIAGLVCAIFAAAFCWLAGLAMTSHPLLPELRHAARGLAVVVPQFRRWRSAQ